MLTGMRDAEVDGITLAQFSVEFGRLSVHRETERARSEPFLNLRIAFEHHMKQDEECHMWREEALLTLLFRYKLQRFVVGNHYLRWFFKNVHYGKNYILFGREFQGNSVYGHQLITAIARPGFLIIAGGGTCGIVADGKQCRPLLSDDLVDDLPLFDHAQFLPGDLLDGEEVIP